MFQASIPYSPGLGHPEPDEAETSGALVETMCGVAEKTNRHYGYPARAVCAKSHRLLRGGLTVLGGFAPLYAQGLVARPASYPAALRLSTDPCDLLDDSISVPRGLAMKVVGVEGERLPGPEGMATQDFVMVNAQAFPVPTAQRILASHVAEFSIARVTPMPKALTGRKVDVAERPDALRKEVMAQFASRDAEWELRVQLEDASVPWPEQASPFVAIARLPVPARPS